MAFNFNNPQQFQLPQLFEQLAGSPTGEQVGLDDTFGMNDYYKKMKFWNDFKGVGLGQMNLGEIAPTQFKDNSFSIGNDFSDTNYL